MKNIKRLSARVAVGLFSLLVSMGAAAQSITSPNGLLKLTFSLTANGEPVYELTYKDKVAEAFPLGTGTEKGCRFDERFHPAQLKNICF